MLYQLGDGDGAVQFEVAPVNVHQVDQTRGFDFAEKAVLGRRPRLEGVGQAAEELAFQGKLFPKRIGGLDEFQALHKLRSAGKSVHLMRGDGTPLGWFVIRSIREGSTFLAKDGIGQVIDFDLQLARADPPAGSSVSTKDPL